MTNIVVPYAENPDSTVGNQTSYTVPAGKYAHITCICPDSSSTVTVNGNKVCQGSSITTITGSSLNVDSNDHLVVVTGGTNDDAALTFTSQGIVHSTRIRIPAGAVVAVTGNGYFVKEEYSDPT